MKSQEPRARMHWQRTGGAVLTSSTGVDHHFLGGLTRIEVERLLTLADLPVVHVECGGGVTAWVTGAEAVALWGEVQVDFEDVERRPPGMPSGALPYRAQLWQAVSGEHLMVLTNE